MSRVLVDSNIFVYAFDPAERVLPDPIEQPPGASILNPVTPDLHLEHSGLH